MAVIPKGNYVASERTSPLKERPMAVIPERNYVASGVTPRVRGLALDGGAILATEWFRLEQTRWGGSAITWTSRDRGETLHSD